MAFFIIILSLLLLIVLISYFKVDAFLSFVIASLLAAVCLGIPLENIPAMIDKGIGSIMGNLTLIIALGAMIGKLVAESGAAKKIADVMVGLFGIKHIQWGLMLTGFIVGIPLFYGVGFVLLIPIIFSIVYQYKLPAIYIGLPMLAALSVAFGFLPPHPSPVALASLFHADIGITLVFGIIIAIPAIIVAGPLFSQTLKGIKTGPLKLFEAHNEVSGFSIPGKANSFISATLPVFMLIFVALISTIFPDMPSGLSSVFALIGSPSVVMLIAVIIATYTLGIRQGRSMKEVMVIYTDAIKDIAGILLIIAGSGIFKQVMEDSGVSLLMANAMQELPVHPLILGWMIAGIIRGCVGSATIAALTAAGVIMPLAIQTQVNPNLMVLALGAGSLMFSHVNDSGFWLFKEYFNISIKDTLRSWSVMEIIVSVMGIIGVWILHLFV
jgi:Gnt-I system high-affinity gluconate transporter